MKTLEKDMIKTYAIILANANAIEQMNAGYEKREPLAVRELPEFEELSSFLEETTEEACLDFLPEPTQEMITAELAADIYKSEEAI